MKDKILKLLEDKKIKYEIIEHGAINTIDEMNALKLPNSDVIAKNLFIRDDKKRNYFLFVLKESKRMNLKKIRQDIDSRPLSFASEESLNQLLKLPMGAVTPFGILNDESKTVKVYIDSEFQNTLIGVHPNENTSTVWLKTVDLVKIIEEEGYVVKYIDI